MSLISISVPLDPGSNPGGADGPIGFRGSFFVSAWAFWTRTAGGAVVDLDSRHISWARNVSKALAPYTLSRYANTVMFENANDTRDCYDPQSWDRLKRVKAAYDPYNLFRELDYYKAALGTQPTDAAIDSGVL